MEKQRNLPPFLKPTSCLYAISIIATHLIVSTPAPLIHIAGVIHHQHLHKSLHGTGVGLESVFIFGMSRSSVECRDFSWEFPGGISLYSTCTCTIKTRLHRWLDNITRAVKIALGAGGVVNDGDL